MRNKLSKLPERARIDTTTVSPSRRTGLNATWRTSAQLESTGNQRDRVAKVDREQGTAWSRESAKEKRELAENTLSKDISLIFSTVLRELFLFRVDMHHALCNELRVHFQLAVFVLRVLVKRLTSNRRHFFYDC